MGKLSDLEIRLRWLVFGLTFMVALGWAWTTAHVWEDYYITYRSSKNLATGNGLVFTPGDRLHTFTSPLGVLLPAAASRLTGNQSDTTAIWIFRFWSSAAFAGAAAFLFTIARRLQYGAAATLLVVAFAALDAKSIDFTTNGMETGFLLLFLTYSLWSLLACRHRRALHLGLAWAGLMWTRPDSFLYIGLLSAGVFFFNDSTRTGLNRREWLKTYLIAGLLCTILYLPWFLWAWSYYGSPVPHTIVAKGGVSDGTKTVLGALVSYLRFPWTVWRGTTSLDATFLASYFQIGGWPGWVVAIARGAALVLAGLWILPFWRTEVRVASLAFAGMHVYLSYYPFFPFPWYLPGTIPLAAIMLGGLVAQATAARDQDVTPDWRRGLARGATVGVAVLIAGQCWLTWQMMRQMKVEQQLSANAVRKQTGLWLKEHAAPGDTVFMEPLGHISYFSGLKTYDFPGLSSREMVRAIRAVGVDWGYLVEYLSPDWIVLRPWEIDRVRRSVPRVVNETYVYATQFDTNAELEKQAIYGRNYVAFDSHWIVFHRQKPKHYQVDISDQATLANFPLPGEGDNVPRLYKLHAAGLLSYKAPAQARHVRLLYSLPPATYQGTPATDGAEFEVRIFDGRTSRTVLKRFLNPVKVESDRGVHMLDADLPAPNGDAVEVIIMSNPGPSDPMDWCCWSLPQFSP